MDLQITKSDGRDSAVPGLTRLQYTIVVTNAGPSAAQSAWVIDELPEGLLNVARHQPSDWGRIGQLDPRRRGYR